HSDVTIQYVFDAIQDDPGVLPGTLPTSNRYLLQWTAGAFDYAGPFIARDMAGIPAAAQGQGAKMFDYLFYEHAPAGTALYVTIVTGEGFSNTVPPDTSATWGL